MRISNIITEATTTRGRTFNHLEDLVMFYGSSGAQQSIARLQDIARDPGQIRWKWDGKPQVYWGRDASGKLIVTGHNGWLKPDKSGQVYSAQDLARFIMNTGKASTEQEILQRQAFATEFASLWPLFEAATPKDFQGYVYGDLLYMRRPALQQGKYVFTPNQVTYSVDARSELGQRISRSTAALVGHAYFPEFGLPDNAQQPIKNFEMFNQNPGLIVLGPRYAQSRPQVDTSKLKQIAQYVRTNAAEIDKFLDDQVLSANRMANFKNVLYKFNNQQARSGSLSDLAGKFLDWLAGSGESGAMQEKIRNWVTQHQKGFLAMFTVLENIRDVKDQIINQIDQEGGDIQQSVAGEPGGEGYVLYNPQGNVKLVPRHRWAPH